MQFKNLGLIRKGIIDGKHAYIGPELAHINISGFCTADCIMCWDFHPSRADLKSFFKRIRKNFLDFDVLKKLLDELHDLKTSTISLVGSGEPLLHPRIKDIFYYLKSNNFTVNLLTSGIMINDVIAGAMKDLDLNLKISLHGGDFDTWHKVHPKLGKKHFENLVSSLEQLSKYKNIKIYLENVISKANYKHIGTLVDFAIKINAKEVTTSFVDIFPEIEFLKLEKEDLVVLEEEVRDALEKAKKHDVNNNFQLFLDRINEKKNTKFSTKELYSKIPCILGWVWTTIGLDGSVYPCCDSKYYLGNVYKEDFASIWNSEKYYTFRELSKSIPSTGNPVPKSKCWDCHLYSINRHYEDINAVPSSSPA